MPDPTNVTVDGLEFYVYAPETVTVADTFDVRVVARNPANEKRTVTTRNGCFVRPKIVNEAGDRVAFKGSGIGCYTAITTHEIPGGDAWACTYDVQAVVRTSDGTEPVSPGTYTVQVVFERLTEEEEVERTVIEREMVVQR